MNRTTTHPGDVLKEELEATEGSRLACQDRYDPHGLVYASLRHGQ